MNIYSSSLFVIVKVKIILSSRLCIMIIYIFSFIITRANIFYYSHFLLHDEIDLREVGLTHKVEIVTLSSKPHCYFAQYYDKRVLP